MQRTVIRTLAVLAALSAGLVPAVAAAADDATDRIDGWITERMQVPGIPGAAVAVIEGSETIHLRGYGHADRSGRPVTAQTPFMIGSASKPFTASVVLNLVEEGVLSLDERVLPYLAHLVDDPPADFEQVTIGQLLDPTSGLAMTVGVAGGAAIRHVAVTLPRWQQKPGADRWRRVLPTVGYAVPGTVLLLAVRWVPLVTSRPTSAGVRRSSPTSPSPGH